MERIGIGGVPILPRTRGEGGAVIWTTIGRELETKIGAKHTRRKGYGLNSEV